jgi:phosphomannomutase
VPRVFGTSGIRGVFPGVVNPELALRLSRALARYFNYGTCALGRDARLPSLPLSLALASGLTASRCSVVDLGLVHLAVVPWAVRRYRLGFGVYVTASHNPPQYCGVKVFREGGVEVTSEDEVAIESLLDAAGYGSWDEVGGYTELNALGEYVEELESVVRPGRVRRVPRVVLDVAHGPTALMAPRVLVDMGVRALVVNGNVDGRFPHRYPEPRPDVLEPYLPLLRALDYDAVLAFDGDGDRLAVVTRRGFVKQDRVIALFARYVLQNRRGTVVVSVDCGGAVREVAEAYGGRLVYYRLGKTHEGLLRYGDAVLAAEPWKVIDPRWGTWIDGVYQAAYLAKVAAEEGRDFDGLLEGIPDYPQARYSVAVPEGVKLQVFSEVVEELRSRYSERATLTEVDGLRLDFDDGSWVLVRASGTEPKVRLYAEARTVDRLRSAVNEVLELIASSLSRRGLKPESVEGSLIP